MDKKFMVLFAFIFVVMALSVCPTGVDDNGLHLLNRYDVPEPIKNMQASALGVDNVFRVTDTMFTSDSTEDIALGQTVTQSRTIFFPQYRGSNSDDASSENQLVFYWKDSNEITAERYSGSSAGQIEIVLWVVEFSSDAGVTVTELGSYSTTGTYSIGHTIDTSESFIISNGAEADDSYTKAMNWPYTYISSTTQITVENYYTEDWTKHYCQLVEVDGASVQRGHKTIDSASSGTQTITSVTTSETMILTQAQYRSTFAAHMGYSTHYATLTDSTTITFTRPSSVGQLEIRWEAVDWPSGVDVQYIFDNGLDTGQATEDTTISSVDTSYSIALRCGGGGGFSGTTNSLTDDAWMHQKSTTEFTSSTNVRTTRGLTTGNNDFYIMVMEFPSNTAPQADQAPTCADLDDTDNLYAKHEDYSIVAYVSDADGYADIDYLTLSCWSDNRGTEYWRVKYDEDTNTFSEDADASGYIALDTGTSSATRSGNDIDATFEIEIDWDHPDITQTDFEVEVFDAAAESDDDYYEVNWDIETRLDLYENLPTEIWELDDNDQISDRGEINGGITASGKVIYYGGTTFVTDVVDVWVSCAAVASSPWSDTSIGASGAFSMTVYADDVVGQDTYTFKVVANGGGSGGTDLLDTTHTDTYIADEVKLTFTSSDSRINPDDSIVISVTAYWDYDDTYITGSSFTAEGLTFTWSAAYSEYRATESALGSVGSKVYDTITNWPAGPTPNYDTLNNVNEDITSHTQIWDEVKVTGYSASDSRDNINDNINVDVTIVYDYDETAVTDGTVTINGESASHQGSGVWRITVSESTAQANTYDTVASSGNTHGISTVNQNGQSVTVVWDSLTVSVVGPTDDRQDLNSNASGIVFSVVYDYDGATYDGTFTLNNTDFDGDGTAVLWGYTVSSANGDDTYGITAISSNAATSMVWDSLTITISGPTDDRQDINANASGIVASATRDYDNSAFDGTLTFNNTDWDGDGTVVRWGYTISSASGGTYGITAIGTNDETSMIWDRIVFGAVWFEEADNRTYAGVPTRNIYAYYQYDYDNTNVTDASATVIKLRGNHTPVSFTTFGGLYDDSNNYWYYAFFTNFVRLYTFGVATAADDVFLIDNDGVYGLTAQADPTDNELHLIWDKIIWQSIAAVNATQNYGGDGYRVNESQYVNITIQLQYEYDNANVVDGTVTFGGASGGEAMTHIANGYWYLIVQNTTSAFGQHYNFTGFTASGNVYGITTENTNSQSLSVIWDEIYVWDDGCDYTDNLYGRVDVSMDVTLWAKAWLVYDKHNLTTGDQLNFADITMTWNGTHFTASGYNEAIPGEYEYTLNATGSSEATYDITVGSNNPVNITFDRIKIHSMWVNDSSPSYGGGLRVWASLVSDYDNESMTTGLVQLNGTLGVEVGGDYNMTYYSTSHWDRNVTASAVANYSYLVTWANWTTYNLTTINYNGWNVTPISAIWDRIIVRGYATNSSDNRDNINTGINVTVWLQYEFDSVNVTDGVITINGDSFSYNAVIMNWTAAFSNASVSASNWNTVACDGSDARGITSVNQNGMSQTYIWDRVVITLFVNEPIAGTVTTRFNTGLFSRIRIQLKLEYDGTTLGSGDNVSISEALVPAMSWNGTHFTKTIESKSEATSQEYHLTMVNETTYQITSLYQTNNTITCIWDELIITITGPDDQRIDLNENATGISASAVRAYDSSVFDGTLTFNNTDFDGDGTVVRWGYTISAASGGTYGITQIDSGDNDNTYVVWDRVNVTVYVNMTWTVVTYYANVSYNGTYEYDSAAWNGYATIYNTPIETTDSVYSEVLTKTSEGNHTFYPTLITDPTHGLSGFSNNTAWCVFDNITGNAFYYFTYATASTNVFSVILSNVTFAVNGSYVSSNWVMTEYANGTWFANNTGTGGYSMTPGITTTTTATGDAVVLVINATLGTDYNFQWYNVTASPETVAEWNEIYFYGPDGIGLDSELFKIYVDGEQISSRDPGYHGSVGDTINITVLNFLDEQIYTNASVVVPSNRFINIELSVYTLSIWNQAPEFIYFNLTSTGGAEYSAHMGQEIYRLAIYASTDYTFTYTVLGGPSAGTHTGTLNIDADYGLIIDSWSNLEIYEGVQRIGGGGADTDDIARELNALMGGTLQTINLAFWGIFGGLAVLVWLVAPLRKGEGEVPTAPSFSDDGKGDKPSKKRKGPVPKQLKDFEFKEGLLNPNFRGKHALDEMSDDIWARLKDEKKKKKKKKR